VIFGFESGKLVLPTYELRLRSHLAVMLQVQGTIKEKNKRIPYDSTVNKS